MSLSVYQLVGLGALVLFLFPYAMVSLGRWQQEWLRVHILNLLGAGAILISLIESWNLPVFLLEVSWGAISLYGIRKAWLKKA